MIREWFKRLRSPASGEAMTGEKLIAEGRKLARPYVALTPVGQGPVAAMWFERDCAEIERTGERHWLTVDAAAIPGEPAIEPGLLNVYTDEKKCEGGRVEITSSWPEKPGIRLFPKPAMMLPPINAVLQFGSDAAGRWFEANGCMRDRPFNGVSKDANIENAYERVLFNEHPLYVGGENHAYLGGWHLAWPDGDWRDLSGERLLIHTIRDSEPWVEAWRLSSGEFKIIQRIT